MPEGEGRRRALVLVRRLRLVVVGGALVAAAAGVAFGVPLLVGLGLVVAAEESLEFAVLASALRLDGRQVRERARRGYPGAFDVGPTRGPL